MQAIVYASDAAVHQALGQPGAPVPQGATPAVSAERLHDFIYMTIRGTPLSETEHCVVEAATVGGMVYDKTIFHRLPQDLYFRIIQHLAREFVTNQTPTATWSRRVCRPPASPLVTLIRVVGGVGSGSVFMMAEAFAEGIFRH